MALFTSDVRLVLDLLTGDQALATADAWEDALRGDGRGEPEGRAGAAGASSGGLLDAIAAVVPQLTDYKIVHENLGGLLEFGERQSLQQLFDVTTKWLAYPQSHPAFCRWLYAYLEEITDRMADVDALRWKQALLVAALQENEPGLKRLLLGLIDRRIGSLENTVSASAQREDGVVRLVLFYWRNADKLCQSSQLCAAKLVGLLDGSKVQSTEVVAVLRWGRLLKPLLFENLVELLRVMDVFPPVVETELAVSNSMAKLVNETAATRPAIMKRLQTAQQYVSSALERGVEHVFRSPSSRSHWMAEAIADYSTHVDRLLLDLHLDLVAIPAAVFPSIFAAYVALATSVLHGKASGVRASRNRALCVRGIYSLLLERTDSPSLLLILAAIIDLEVAHISVWRDNTEIFCDLVEELGEAIVLEVDSSKRQILQISLLHLLLECDVHVVRAHASFLSDRLPEQSYRLVVHRISGLERSS